MTHITRRRAIQTFGAAGAGALLTRGGVEGRETGQGQVRNAGDAGLRVIVAGRRVQIAVQPVSDHTVRISIVPVENGRPAPIAYDGSLVRRVWSDHDFLLDMFPEGQPVKLGNLTVAMSMTPLTIQVKTRDGKSVQQLRVDEETGAVTFQLGTGPILGFGEGGPQFDRRGIVDKMRSGQGGYRLRTHGGRVPIPWLIGTSGTSGTSDVSAAAWAMFVHQPFGAFDLSGPEGRFDPGGLASALPIDIFIVSSRDPVQIMAEWARLTGRPELPPLWSLGYQQSHRTLASREEVMGVARTFREKRLPCDALIYLGTGFTPSGWNTANGSFTFNRNVFTDPKAVLDELHTLNFHVVLHAVILARALRGGVQDQCDLSRYDEEEAGCYWNTHRKLLAMGVDGWWPDEGDPLDIPSRLARNRMYWEGPQLDRPNERPYALHRNGYAGMQRYASFLWSGDVYSTWETLRTHVPIAINTGLSGIPYWGTDIGGFVPTKEFTGELYVRWFQFGAFCPLFRSHGRTWKLRLPWGWNTGDFGLSEITNYGEAANPDPSELHNAQVEPICRQYLELRYRLLPYLYSAVRESTQTGLPIMRALWLHYPDDPAAVARSDSYLWGRDMLVAPITEPGATTRRLYLPRGRWFDFWNEGAIDGGREIDRAVDLATMPLYVRAGAVIPMGPVKQHTGERSAGGDLLVLTVYPGADGATTVYEDDGKSFDYRKGAWMGLRVEWSDSARRLTVRLADGSRMLPPDRRSLEVRVAGSKNTKQAVFDGRPLQIQL
jgi:alpha-glucosidase (family GH31 glycosyl hydrolase)